MNALTFWKRFFFLCLCVILLDFLIGKSLEFFYFKQKKGRVYNITVALEKQTSDVLILGSSRAMHHYNPEILSDSLKRSCYNAGYDGQSILYCKGVLDVVLERHKPKVVILDLTLSEFDQKETSYDMLYALNPYVKRHPILWKTLSLKSKAEKIKHFSSIYPYNSMIVEIAIGNMSGSLKKREISENGFTPSIGIWKEKITTVDFPDSALDAVKTKAFKDICSFCSENNIDLYVVISPAFHIIENVSSSISYLERVCDSLNVPLLNFINDINYMDNHHYKDMTHLNAQGADLFSKDVSHRILAIKDGNCGLIN